MTQIYQHMTIGVQEKRWLVDCQAASKIMSWIKRTPQALIADVEGMQTYFPHWILVASRNQKPLYCDRCQQFYVPTDGATRCLQCRQTVKAAELMWLGHIPVLARPEVAFAKRQAALREKEYDEVSLNDETYLLVPLTVSYPQEWPNTEPIVRYGKTWLKTLGIPNNSSRHHLISHGRACIFAWGQWQAMPIHAVLQQRMVNHIMSLFKTAAGQSPEAAFIGRIHRQNWHPES